MPACWGGFSFLPSESAHFLLRSPKDTNCGDPSAVRLISPDSVSAFFRPLPSTAPNTPPATPLPSAVHSMVMSSGLWLIPRAVREASTSTAASRSPSKAILP